MVPPSFSAAAAGATEVACADESNAGIGDVATVSVEMAEMKFITPFVFFFIDRIFAMN